MKKKSKPKTKESLKVPENLSNFITSKNVIKLPKSDNSVSQSDSAASTKTSFPLTKSYYFPFGIYCHRIYIYSGRVWTEIKAEEFKRIRFLHTEIKAFVCWLWGMM